jgi:hypothetical protein
MRRSPILIVTALVCLSAGPPAQGDEPPLTQEQAIARIALLGGKVGINRNKPGHPLVSVVLSGVRIADRDVAFLARIPTLRSVSLEELPISDNALTSLMGLDLRFMSLRKTRVSDMGLKALRGMSNLKALMLDETAITDKGLRELKGLGQLLLLSVRKTRVTRQGVKGLSQALPKLRILR